MLWYGSCVSLREFHKVYCAPGNGGIAEEAECLPADVKSIDSLVAAAKQVQSGSDYRRPGVAALPGSGG